jgi:hypothetical protein
MDDDGRRLFRIESKLDRLAELVAAHVAAEEALKRPRAPVTAIVAAGAAVLSVLVTLFVALARHVG